jgi:hypothetical protein
MELILVIYIKGLRDMNEKIAQLVPTKSDKEIAEELRKELAEAAKPYLDACTKANSLGFVVNSHFGIDPFGRYVITQLNLMKYY